MLSFDEKKTTKGAHPNVMAGLVVFANSEETDFPNIAQAVASLGAISWKSNFP